MPNPPGKPIMFQESTLKEIDRCHRFYVRFPGLKRDYQLIQTVPQNGIVLDIGCAEGTYLKRVSLMRPDLKLIGLDIDCYLEVIERKQLDSFVIADCNVQLPLPDESIDFVHCTHIIEHLQRPSMLLKEIRRVLKKEGQAYVEAPEAKRIFMPSLGLRGTANFYDDPTHIRPYTKEALRRLGLEAGFKEASITVFFARNYFYLVSFFYILFRFMVTGDNIYLQSILQPIIGLDVGAVFKKD